jgi:hypothetical protein
MMNIEKLKKYPNGDNEKINKQKAAESLKV